MVLARKACEIDLYLSNAAVARWIQAHWDDPAYSEECGRAVARVYEGRAT